MDDLFFSLMLRHPPLGMLNPMDVVFSPSSINAMVEEFCVGVSIF